jgi:hypothetical protein
MRNEPKPLDRTAAARADALRDSLIVGDYVRLTYTKRNGKTSSSTGEVAFHNGQDGMDTMSVTLNTPDKGARTINLAGVITAQKATRPE